MSTDKPNAHDILEQAVGLPYYFGSEMAVLPVIDHEE